MEKSLSPKEKKLFEKLRGVVDPEFGFSIADRGLLDEVKIEGNTARITYHLTAPFCPFVFAVQIGREIKKKAKEVEGIEKVEVKVKDHIQTDVINEALRKE